MTKIVPFIGMVFIIALAWLLSNNRKLFPWKTVIGGTMLQFVFAFFILKTWIGIYIFQRITDSVNYFLNFADTGSKFLFGEQFTEHFIAFKVLPSIIFFSSFITVLYYLGIIQKVIEFLAHIMIKILGTSGAETLSVAANIFVGQTESPLLIKPYLEEMTDSEIMAVMTGGFATVAGGVLAAYIGMGIPSSHLLAASVMSAPAALVISKVMFPETQESKTAGVIKLSVDKPGVNVIDAAARGARDGLFLTLNVAAMLIAFIAFIDFFNSLTAWLGNLISIENLTLEKILGVLLAPLAFLMGVPWQEAFQVGYLMGIKTVVNEFVAYAELQQIVKDGGLSERSIIIATYALCGFSNFGSIAIQIGGISSIAPTKSSTLARLGLRAMIAGSLACFQTATIAGILL